MGIMSKGSRLPERPLPPSAAERDKDILSIDDTDIVFSLGQECLTDYYKGLSSSSANEDSTSSPNLNSSTSSTGSDITQDQVNESYSDVTRLLSLYSDLKDVPLELENKYGKLKNTSEELTNSISKLRGLSLDFGIDTLSDSSSNSCKKSSDNALDSSSSNKGKMKSRKKK